MSIYIYIVYIYRLYIYRYILYIYVYRLYIYILNIVVQPTQRSRLKFLWALILDPRNPPSPHLHKFLCTSLKYWNIYYHSQNTKFTWKLAQKNKLIEQQQMQKMMIKGALYRAVVIPRAVIHLRWLIIKIPLWTMIPSISTIPSSATCASLWGQKLSC